MFTPHIVSSPLTKAPAVSHPGLAALKADPASLQQTPDSEDTVNISGQAKSLNTGRSLMSATTMMGSQMTVEAMQPAGNSLRMGNSTFQQTQSLFTLNGAADKATEYAVTFTHANGTSQTFTVDAAASFYQQADGTVHSRPGGDAEGLEAQSIIVNVADGASIRGGKGDDLILNVGLGAKIDAGEGSDKVISMGDNAHIDGGLGDDRINIMKDALGRKSADTSTDISRLRIVLPGLSTTGGGGNSLFSEAHKYYDAEGKTSRPHGSQTVSVSGSEGADTIVSEAVLYASDIQGGDGADYIKLDDLVRTRLDGGAGDDTLDMKLAVASTISGGQGDDEIRARFIKDSQVRGDEGNDTITALGANNSIISGGSGDDLLKIDEIHATLLRGDEGNDTILLSRSQGSSIQGGDGNDTIVVGQGDGMGSFLLNSVIDGGDGDDTISVNLTGKGSGPLNGIMSGSVIEGGEGSNNISVQVGTPSSGLNSVGAASAALDKARRQQLVSYELAEMANAPSANASQPRNLATA